MVNKHCCYGLCKNDSRKKLENVFFIPFPKPLSQPEKCKRWINLCGRQHADFNVSKINKYTYICSVHFVGGSGPTSDYPDPVPAIQIGSTGTTPVIKKSRKPPRRVVWSDSTQAVHDHNYASPTSVGLIPPAADSLVDMDISFSTDDHPILSDNCTQVSSSVFTNACTQVDPVTMVDASTQTDADCDNSLRRHLFVDNVTKDNKNCRFWTGIQTLSLMNFIFECVTWCRKNDIVDGEKRSKTSYFDGL